MCLLRGCPVPERGAVKTLAVAVGATSCTTVVLGGGHRILFGLRLAVGGGGIAVIVLVVVIILVVVVGGRLLLFPPGLGLLDLCGSICSLE